MEPAEGLACTRRKEDRASTCTKAERVRAGDVPLVTFPHDSLLIYDGHPDRIIIRPLAGHVGNWEGPKNSLLQRRRGTNHGMSKGLSEPSEENIKGMARQ